MTVADFQVSRLLYKARRLRYRAAKVRRNRQGAFVVAVVGDERCSTGATSKLVRQDLPTVESITLGTDTFVWSSLSTV